MIVLHLHDRCTMVVQMQAKVICFEMINMFTQRMNMQAHDMNVLAVCGLRMLKPYVDPKVCT